jgi:hypothetical protein
MRQHKPSQPPLLLAVGYAPVPAWQQGKGYVMFQMPALHLNTLATMTL